jgi:hypothetical protein
LDRLLLLLLAIVPPFAGADRCAQCHPDQARSQAASRHAGALRRADESLAALLGDRPLRERSGVEFAYAAAADGVKVTVSQGPSRVEALLEWAFGAGAQAVTPVGRAGDRYFEHRISWYRAPGHPARTLGHPGEASSRPERAIGLVQGAATITRCFSCHATGVEPGPRLDNMQPGVNCERCHGPGLAHATRPGRSNIRVLSQLPAAAVVEACAECHRGPDANVRHNDPAAVRFQPIGLMASKCFQSSGALSCVTCHDPHRDLSRDAVAYTATCAGCHPSSAGARQCRRGTGENCLPCHMPARQPFPFLTFTDHRIGVYR